MPTQVVKRNQSVEDTINLIKQTSEKHKLSDAVRSLDVSGSKNLMTMLESIFNQIKSRTTYRFDEPEREQIKTPDRFLLDDKFGDCDDFTVLWSAFLKSFNMPHFLKIVKYKLDENWAHIYVIVPLKSEKYIPLDNVLGTFNKEVKHVKSKLFRP